MSLNFHLCVFLVLNTKNIYVLRWLVAFLGRRWNKSKCCWSASWVVCHVFSSIIWIYVKWRLFAWSRVPGASSVFTLDWHVGQKRVNNNYLVLAWRSCWINKVCVVEMVNVVRMPGGSSRSNPSTAAVDINWIGVGINSSLFLWRKIDGFWVLHMCCAVKELSVSPSDHFSVLPGLRSTFLEAFWKERKTAVFNLNSGKRSRRNLTNEFEHFWLSSC